ncbi:MAG: trypsin-like peptidase domain-containing protein [Nanoarchaeota archaeon]|nr:trypsin-like peptidase domain-containing protein [Nanoarchaeota archaeon]
MIDRRDLLKIGAVSFVASSIPLATYHYVFLGISNRILNYHIDGILENEVVFSTHASFKHPSFGRDEEKQMDGPGTIVKYKGKNYIFTVDHLTSVKEIQINMGSFGRQSLCVKGTFSEESRLGVILLEKIVSHFKRDVAVFKLPEGYETPNYKVRLADNDDQETLDKVYLLGKPRGIRRNIREGIIANKIGISKFSDGTEFEGFNISTGGYFGDSGTPAINSSGEIIGFFSQLHFNSISSYIMPINWYKEEIDKYESTQKVLHTRCKEST